MLGARISLLVALAIGTPFIAKASDYILPAGVTVFTEEQLFDQLIGSTTSNGRWSDYWEPPSTNQKKGRFRGVHKKYGKYAGSWSIKGHLFCYKADNPPMSDFPGCYTYALNGDTINQYGVDGKEYVSRWGRLKLTSGNPENL